MGLTTRKLQSQLVTTKLPHYFVVKRGPFWQRHCGTQRDVDCLLSIYPDATVTQVFPPNPTVVDVSHTTIQDKELPQSELEPINFNNDKTN